MPLKVVRHAHSDLYDAFPERCSAVPWHFRREQARRNCATRGVKAEVVAPIGYVPNLKRLPSRYLQLRLAPAIEERRGLTIHHPRYLVIPKLGMLVAPLTLYRATRRYIEQAGIEFDLIDAHYFYPDGVAAILLARQFRKPVVISARGSDITLLARYSLPRRMIRWAAGKADAIITVCAALRDALIALGADGSKIVVLRNGVDLSLFQPGDPAESRMEAGLAGRMLLSVGGLIPRKGHDLAIRALAHLPDCTLAIVGEGPERDSLVALARTLGLGDRVKFLGWVRHGDLPAYYRSADLLLLLSRQEGWANVLLEALACGTRVVATDVGGTGEVISDPVAGKLLAQPTPSEIAAAVRARLAENLDRGTVRAWAERFSWEAPAQGQIELYQSILPLQAVAD